jgi:hypothetical protein
MVWRQPTVGGGFWLRNDGLICYPFSGIAEYLRKERRNNSEILWENGRDCCINGAVGLSVVQ